MKIQYNGKKIKFPVRSIRKKESGRKLCIKCCFWDCLGQNRDEPLSLLLLGRKSDRKGIEIQWVRMFLL